MAEQKEQPQIEQAHTEPAAKTCANCSKPLYRISRYYRNGKFFCGKGCFKVYNQKLAEEVKQKSQETAKTKTTAEPKPAAENKAPTEPKPEQKS